METKPKPRILREDEVRALSDKQLATEWNGWSEYWDGHKGDNDAPKQLDRLVDAAGCRLIGRNLMR